jgi:transposase-like protein
VRADAPACRKSKSLWHCSVANSIEALNRQLRKAVKTKGHFPTEDAARKLMYLAIQNAVPQWTRTRGWTKALLAFKIQFGDRLPE